MPLVPGHERLGCWSLRTGQAGGPGVPWAPTIPGSFTTFGGPSGLVNVPPCHGTGWEIRGGGKWQDRSDGQQSSESTQPDSRGTKGKLRPREHQARLRSFSNGTSCGTRSWAPASLARCVRAGVWLTWWAGVPGCGREFWGKNLTKQLGWPTGLRERETEAQRGPAPCVRCSRTPGSDGSPRLPILSPQPR